MNVFYFYLVKTVTNTSEKAQKRHLRTKMQEMLEHSPGNKVNWHRGIKPTDCDLQGAQVVRHRCTESETSETRRVEMRVSE